MPTRSRAIEAVKAYGSYRDTKALSSTDLIPVLDSEDPTYDAYVALFEDKFPDWKYAVTKGNMVERTNVAAMLQAKSDPKSIIGWMADDNRFVTDMWDAEVQIAFDSRKVGFVVLDDDHWHGSKATVVFVRASIVNALGWFALPTQEHLYVDDAWIDLAEASDSLVVLKDTHVLHLNPLLMGTEQDEQHKFVNRPEAYEKDSTSYLKWRHRGGLEKDAQVVRNVLSV